jgi:hypothetical protein
MMKSKPYFGATYIKTGKSPIASAAIEISVFILNFCYPGAGLPISIMCKRWTVSYAFFSQNAKRLFLKEGIPSVSGKSIKQPA